MFSHEQSSITFPGRGFEPVGFVGFAAAPMRRFLSLRGCPCFDIIISRSILIRVDQALQQGTLVTIGCLYLLFNPHDITANEGCTESRKAAEHDVLLIHSTEKCSYQTRENLKKLELTY